MTKAQYIAEILGVASTDVIVTNDSEARLKDRELTEAEQEQIADVFTPEPLRRVVEQMRAESKQRIDMIAEIIEKAQGQQWAEDKGKIADDIRNANAQGRGNERTD